jgi:hypothetical protein
VHTSISPDNETNLDAAVVSFGHDERIWRRQGFRRLDIFTTRGRTGMRHVIELGGARWICPHSALIQTWAIRDRRPQAKQCDGLKGNNRQPKPEATRGAFHFEPLRSGRPLHHP